MTTKAEQISPRLKPNLKKILEAILLLIEHARDEKLTLTQYDIVKTLFVADTFHLTRYGRPITFDNYVAMKFGPVPSAAYDMLKPSYAGEKLLGEEVWPLWDAEPVGKSSTLNFSKPKRKANRKRLSETDISALMEALHLIKAKTFEEIRDWTHLHPAYKAAWKEGGDKKSYPMEYRLLIKGTDGDLAVELAHASKFL